MIHRVVLLTALLIDTGARAQPAPDAPDAPNEHASFPDPGPEPIIGAAELTDLANLAEPTDHPELTDHPAPNDTVLRVVEPPLDPPERRMPMEAQQYAVPLPGRRSRDPALRKARGMLAGGILFTVICGAGSALAIAAAVDRPRRTYGTASQDFFRAATALIGCTVGAIGLAAAGAVRIRRIRHLAEWTGGLGLRF